jgi:hyperosmotically inducible protein
MRTAAILLVSLALGSLACEERGQDRQGETSDLRGGEPGGLSAEATRPEDLQLAESVRQAITADPSLSPSARSVEISSDEGVVVLRGEVQSQDEKDRLESIAQQVAGVQKVENELEVAS